MTRRSDRGIIVVNEFQARGVSAACQHIDDTVSKMEQILSVSNSKAAFPRYHLDISPARIAEIESILTAIRARLHKTLDDLSIPRPGDDIPASQAIQAGIGSIDIAAEELRPRFMRGYGDISDSLSDALERTSGELRTLAAQLQEASRRT